jgi:hypothetical protein
MLCKCSSPSRLFEALWWLIDSAFVVLVSSRLKCPFYCHRSSPFGHSSANKYTAVAGDSINKQRSKTFKIVTKYVNKTSWSTFFKKKFFTRLQKPTRILFNFYWDKMTCLKRIEHVNKTKMNQQKSFIRLSKWKLYDESRKWGKRTFYIQSWVGGVKQILKAGFKHELEST